MSNSDDSDACNALAEQGYELTTQSIVMYPHLGVANRLFGGQLISWIDEAAALAAVKVTGTTKLVTKRVSEVVFEAPGLLGDLLEIWCKPTRRGRTSLTLDCRVRVRREQSGQQIQRQICSCEIVFVVIDDKGRPRQWQQP